MTEQRPSKQEIARQLREWYESGWIRDNTLKQKQAELLWAAIGSLTADEPSARQCNHGAISPKGTMLYHGYVQPKANLWRCDVCKGIYEGNLTEPNTLGSQALTLVGPSEPPTAQASKPPLPALYWYHEFLAWAAHPAESGYVPVHPNTLRSVAKILLEHHRRAEPPAESPLERRIAMIECSNNEPKPKLELLFNSVEDMRAAFDFIRATVTKSEIPAAAQSAANSGQCESRKAAQSGTAAGSSVETSGDRS